MLTEPLSLEKKAVLSGKKALQSRACSHLTMLVEPKRKRRKGVNKNPLEVLRKEKCLSPKERYCAWWFLRQNVIKVEVNGINE